jgi:protein-disulfide isomerase
MFQQIKFLELSHNIYISLTLFACLFFILALFLLPIRRLQKINSSNKIKLIGLKKWKMDVDLFTSVLQKEQEIDITIWDNDLLVGNLSAPLLVTVVCNLYCKPCAKAHAQLDSLLRRYVNTLKVQVRLVFDHNNQKDKRTIAAKAILQKTAEIDNNYLQEMLNDWFNWMDYNKWHDKWNPDENIEVGTRLMDHNTWIKNSDIAYTPSIFLNGKKIPGRYSLEDIEILIPQLANQIIF